MEAETFAYGPVGRTHRPKRRKSTKRARKIIAGWLLATMLLGGGAFAAWFTSQVFTGNGSARFADVQAISGITDTYTAYASITGRLSPGDTGKALSIDINNTANATAYHVLSVTARSGSLTLATGSPGPLCSDVSNDTFVSGEYAPLPVASGGSGQGITTHSQTGLNIVLPASATTTITVPNFLDVSAGINSNCASQAFVVPVTITVGP
jgi:hypothetical protein